MEDKYADVNDNRPGLIILILFVLTVFLSGFALGFIYKSSKIETSDDETFEDLKPYKDIAYQVAKASANFKSREEAIANMEKVKKYFDEEYYKVYMTTYEETGGVLYSFFWYRVDFGESYFEVTENVAEKTKTGVNVLIGGMWMAGKHPHAYSCASYMLFKFNKEGKIIEIREVTC
ncbi:hypothetical protein SAMN02745221_02204 [Thermosyntropha lipolytica DSM 11003]|uniref:Uncharacterized protein n=1 Tax=Thermosyntropha lipolytica DSM 11003 TaxID=1123382 RepID=A0A1M5SCR7_9FIRM|nr:hypothetical protein [Thermosyntropha lipolytica]SHH36265.1 hypothetical protein SAMN02745221_02204 [Thermosyntropha lipolytica DSM 11003]